MFAVPDFRRLPRFLRSLQVLPVQRNPRLRLDQLRLDLGLFRCVHRLRVGEKVKVEGKRVGSSRLLLSLSPSRGVRLNPLRNSLEHL